MTANTISNFKNVLYFGTDPSLALVTEAVFKGAFPGLSLVKVTTVEEAIKALVGDKFRACTDPFEAKYKGKKGRNFDAVVCGGIPQEADTFIRSLASKVICLSDQDRGQFPKDAVVFPCSYKIDGLEAQFKKWDLI